MKRLIALCFTVIFLFTSCSDEKKVYGVWYNEANGIRNVIQFSESADGESAFIWAVYDIDKDETTSISKGYFKADNKQIVFTFIDNDSELILDYSINDNVLTLSSETSNMILEKYEL